MGAGQGRRSERAVKLGRTLTLVLAHVACALVAPYVVTDVSTVASTADLRGAVRLWGPPRHTAPVGGSHLPYRTRPGPLRPLHGEGPAAAAGG
ncbi:hypothetical protein [Deinococcus sp.]|uniref:hypothetical protein n=1 Tax=Deinococcus sp. TaxID=47478 RepID=UPI003CC5CD10